MATAAFLKGVSDAMEKKYSDLSDTVLAYSAQLFERQAKIMVRLDKLEEKARKEGR